MTHSQRLIGLVNCVDFVMCVCAPAHLRRLLQGVGEEGVESWGHLFTQRTRWAWGNLQALRDHVLNLKVPRAKIPLRKKFDISIYLAFIVVPFLVLLCWIWFISDIFGVLAISNAFPVAFTAANSFSFFPLIVYGPWKERKEYPLWQIIPLLFLVTAYTYHWIPCLTSALIKMFTKEPVWEKTLRSNSRSIDS